MIWLRQIAQLSTTMSAKKSIVSIIVFQKTTNYFVPNQNSKDSHDLRHTQQEK